MVRSEAQRRADKKYEANREKRHKIWMIIFYEESAPYWRDELDELCLPIVVSPPHDKDKWSDADEKKNPEHKAGTIKKTHRHLLVEYPVQQTYVAVVEDFSFLNTKNIKFVKSLNAMAAYLCHLKSPDKERYDSDGIIEFGGANWRDWCAQTDDLPGEVKAMQRRIKEEALRTGRCEYYEFSDWCAENNDVWHRLLTLKCAYVIDRYTKSIRGAMKQGTFGIDFPVDEKALEDAVDLETGEILEEKQKIN